MTITSSIVGVALFASALRNASSMPPGSSTERPWQPIARATVARCIAKTSLDSWLSDHRPRFGALAHGPGGFVEDTEHDRGAGPQRRFEIAEGHGEAAVAREVHDPPSQAGGRGWLLSACSGHGFTLAALVALGLAATI